MISMDNVSQDCRIFIGMTLEGRLEKFAADIYILNLFISNSKCDCWSYCRKLLSMLLMYKNYL